MNKQKKINYKEEGKSYFLILIGTILMALGFVFFIAPFRLAPGGVYGIAITVHHFTKGMFDLFPEGIPIGVMALMMDIPLCIIGIWILGPKFGVKTVFGFLSLAFFTDFITAISGGGALMPDDRFLSAVFGGVMLGLGLGLIFRTKATSGGTDIIAMIISKYTKHPVGSTLIIVDSLVVFVGLVVFNDWTIPLYSLVVIYVTGNVIDMVIKGISTDKTVYIISDYHELIRDNIINTLERGGTYIHGEGMYNGKERKIIYTIVSRKELPQLIHFVKEVDPVAFLSVVDATETIGLGFKSIHNTDFH